MEKRIEKADAAVMKQLQLATKNWHTSLAKANVKVAVLMVHPPTNANAEPTAPALTRSGVEVVALIKVATPNERILAGCDAVMRIDAFHWESLIEEQQTALLDHELEHLLIATTAKGLVQKHDDGRPKLLTQPDDWSLTGFAVVVKRHGRHALEAMAIRKVLDTYQELFDFMHAEAAA